MGKLRDKFISFMYGRNGADSLYKASAVLYLIMAAVNIFLRSAVLSVIMWALFIWAMFRCFSKNIYKRSLENQAYLRIEEKVVRKFRMTKTMLTDREHCYKKCSRCKTYLRLPKCSGTHTAVCPKCGERLTVRKR